MRADAEVSALFAAVCVCVYVCVCVCEIPLTLELLSPKGWPYRYIYILVYRYGQYLGNIGARGCESGKCSARGVCMCESASEWEVEMGLPWWCLLCKIVCLFLASGASYVKT